MILLHISPPLLERMNTGLTIGINTFNIVHQNRRKNAGQEDERNDMEVSYTYIMSDRYYLPVTNVRQIITLSPLRQ